MNKIFNIWDKFALWVCSFMSESTAHMLFGTLIGIVATIVFTITTANGTPLIYGFCGLMTAAFIGLAKELIDFFRDENFDAKDLCFTVIGGAIGSVLGALVFIL